MITIPLCGLIFGSGAFFYFKKIAKFDSERILYLVTTFTILGFTLGFWMSERLLERSISSGYYEKTTSSQFLTIFPPPAKDNVYVINLQSGISGRQHAFIIEGKTKQIDFKKDFVVEKDSLTQGFYCEYTITVKGWMKWFTIRKKGEEIIVPIGSIHEGYVDFIYKTKT